MWGILTRPRVGEFEVPAGEPDTATPFTFHPPGCSCFVKPPPSRRQRHPEYRHVRCSGQLDRLNLLGLIERAGISTNRGAVHPNRRRQSRNPECRSPARCSRRSDPPSPVPISITAGGDWAAAGFTATRPTMLAAASGLCQQLGAVGHTPCRRRDLRWTGLYFCSLSGVDRITHHFSHFR